MSKKLENRELYDLCRRYKYAFKKYDEIKHLNKCYWSQHIVEAYKEAEQELKEAKYEIIKYIFEEFINFDAIDMEASRDYDNYYVGNNTVRMPGRVSYKTTVYDQKFFEICSKIKGWGIYE